MVDMLKLKPLIIGKKIKRRDFTINDLFEQKENYLTLKMELMTLIIMWLNSLEILKLGSKGFS